MTEPRRPAAFRVEPEQKKPAPEPRPASAGAQRRAPRAVRADDLAVVTPAEIDVFDHLDAAEAVPPPPTAPRRRSPLATIFFAAFGLLVSLALGLWADRLIRDLFGRADWLGWLAAGAAGVAAAALLMIVLRETLALWRLASVERLRARAADAVARDDGRAAQAVVDSLVALVAGRPQTAAGRRVLAELRGDIIDGRDLVRVAEREILAPLDVEARALVVDAAKRVSLVTAVSPRAVVDIAYVVFECARLVRRIAELYGGRPGTLGFFRLARSAVAHLAVTGSIAAGDSVVQQLVGHGLAARLSAKLGEGVVNGMMTARIGVAAMEVARPLPFDAVKRPGMGDMLAALGTMAPRDVKPTNPA
ncbi:MAG TPA: TIGR01620 family protein [Rhizobiales bacterium]|nr:TIGR01620 family protein [Hyphomicrobiales bacterium]